MKKYIFLLLSICGTISSSAQQFIAEGRKPLAVIPARTTGVAQAVINLNGEWEINMNPGSVPWSDEKEKWKKIQVPGEPAMQGFAVTNDKEFFYRTTIHIPKDATGKKVFVRFNGVYSYARVFVNGQLIREHFGGFTAWEADISSYAKPGQSVEMYVGVTDRADDISYASGYAHHSVGGILRNVQLFVLPEQYLNRLYVQTLLSENFKQSSLIIKAAKNSSGKGYVRFQLYDAKGRPVFNQSKTMQLSATGNADVVCKIMNPVLWNQEQPYLYTLKAELITNGKAEEVIEQKIGFRKIQVDGKRLLVNGDAVKLRGACRHDMHPLLGRSTNRYYDSLDVMLAKEANLNFIRTSHYPPSADFLEFADRYGLYVQEETAICFVNDWRTDVYKKYGETNNDTAFTLRYLGQLSEMIDRDRNHPSIIMWSIGNESNYGINFQKEYEFVKSVDLPRPVSWTWPGSAFKLNKKCFDIAVSHYPSYNGSEDENFGLRYKNMEHESLPLLSDEWAHVACYNTTLLKEDPNVKDFWGRSLDTMWAKRFDVPGNLGGAIWGMTDETFHLPDTVTGYGPWGFIDVWRRKKTEFWNTKKAYSPVRVLSAGIKSNNASGLITVPVKNRFNHLSLNQLILKVTENGKTVAVPLPALKPHEEGTITVKRNDVTAALLLRFYDAANNLIDEEMIPPAEIREVGPVKYVKWKITHQQSKVILQSNKLTIVLDTLTGQLITATVAGKPVLTGAPGVVVNKPADAGAYKESEGIYSGEYKVTAAAIDYSDADKITVTTNGFVSNYPVKMTTVYNTYGSIVTGYIVDSIPAYTWQVGVAFPVDDATDAIEWKRKGYWSTYPANHLSANEGMAKRFPVHTEQYRTQPTYTVAESHTDYYLTGSITAADAEMHGSEAYRAAKENILEFNLLQKESKILTVFSNGLQAAKMNIKTSGKQELLVMNKWDYWTLSWGNYAGSKNQSTQIKGTVVMKVMQ